MHLIRNTILFLFASIIFANAGIAQISVFPPSYNHIIAKAAQSEVPLKKQLSLDTLPFVDDFATEGPFPNTERWEDNHVFINATLALDPPSIGVATFDGLDNTGSPYGTSGSGDTLTSVGINLDINAQNLYISYYVQPKGFGDAPESNDSLILEFKDINGSWINQKTYLGEDVNPFPSDSVVFSFESVEIVSPDFLYDDFQFRFRNTSSGNGAVDLWHLDMVRLVNNQIPSQTYQDLTFQYPSQGILNRYSAMPLNQFIVNTGSYLRDTFSFNIFNHLDVARPIGSKNSTMSITELNSGQVVQAPEQYLTSNNLDIDPDTSLVITVVKEISIDGNSFGNQDALHFQTIFSIEPIEADNDPGLLDNNFITQNTIIGDYYAYDDGSAELGLAAQGSGTLIAVEYQTTVADTLSAIALHFPHLSGDISDQFFNLKVWLDSKDSEPVFTGNLLNTIYVDDFVDTLQGFTTYRLQETFTEELQPVAIPANTTFYVGWEQVTDEFEDPILVGFDITTTEANKYNWFKADGGDWINFDNTTLSGAMMIRPVMGVDNAIYTSTSHKLVEKIEIYPNPSTGEVNIDWANTESVSTQIDVFDVQGKLVHRQTGENNKMQLGFLPAGIYLIHLSDQDNNVLLREKLIIQPK